MIRAGGRSVCGSGIRENSHVTCAAILNSGEFSYTSVENWSKPWSAINRPDLPFADF